MSDDFSPTDTAQSSAGHSPHPPDEIGAFEVAAEGEPAKRVRMVAGAPVIESVAQPQRAAPVGGPLPGSVQVPVSELSLDAEDAALLAHTTETQQQEAQQRATQPLEAATAVQFSQGAAFGEPAPVVPGTLHPTPVQANTLQPDISLLDKQLLEGDHLAAENLNAADQDAGEAPLQVGGAPTSLTPVPITPAQGGWAVLVLLLCQEVIAELGQYWQVPMGTTLLFAFAFSVVALLVLLPYPLRLLRADTRWTTRPRIGVILGALALSFVASRGFILLMLSLWPAASNVGQSLLSKGPLDAALLLLIAGFAIPLAEEVVFRGLLMRGLERSRGSVYAALATSILFGLAHGGPMQVAGIVPLAWIMARSVQYTGSLWTSIGMHMLNNLFAVGVGLWLQNHNLGAAANDSMLGGLSLGHIPWTLGMAGLLLGSAALAVATAWLKPRPVVQPQGDAPRTWTVSTILLAGLVLLSLGYGVWLALHRAAAPNF